MSTTWGEMNEAVKEAKTTIRTADLFIGQMADMMVGRLQRAGVDRRELRDFNMHTMNWKDRSR